MKSGKDIEIMVYTLEDCSFVLSAFNKSEADDVFFNSTYASKQKADPSSKHFDLLYLTSQSEPLLTASSEMSYIGNFPINNLDLLHLSLVDTISQHFLCVVPRYDVGDSQYKYRFSFNFRLLT